MKNVITILMCTFCILTGIAQSDLSGDQLVIPKRTPALEALYQQGRDLEQNGTAAEINANRLAIKNAWQEIDPKVAALYKPIKTINYPQVGGDGTYRPTTIPERPVQTKSPDDWSTDKMLRNGYIDGLDMDVTYDGAIYIAAFENNPGGGSGSELFIYRSTDGGNSFELWQDYPIISSTFVKIQIVTIYGNGDDYLLVYSLFQSEVFSALRWNMATGAMDFQTVANDVIDFGVDSIFTGNTSNQRVFATYNKSTNSTYSARSTAGSYGFDWVDETSLGIVGEQVEFAYGLEGSCYTAFIGFISRNLRANANDNYNDPASWGANETVVDGATIESLNPTIRATRKYFASDEVLIIASSRAAGSSDSYIGQGYRRASGAAYAPIDYISTGSDANVAHIDTWMSTNGPVEVIETAYVRDDIDNSENDTNRSFPYDGTSFSVFEGVGDTGRDVFDGFASVIAETHDGLPCMAFAGTSSSGLYGYGLYFDAQNGVTGIDENTFEGFKFYPNPTQDVLNLSAKNTIESVSIFSMLGQKVMETSINQTISSINIASLNPGVYIMKVMIDGKYGTYKIIKQ